MSDLTHVEQMFDISFGLFFYGSYCLTLKTARIKSLARYIVERQMRNKILGQRIELSAFFLSLGETAATAVVTDSDGGRGCLT